MSILELLKPADGSKHYQKRLGRGRGSGLGQTAGKGHKGQLARSGGKVRRGFEGGQSPLIRRLPKFGFSNVKFETKILALTLTKLESLGDKISPEALLASGVLPRGYKLKIIGASANLKKMNVRAHFFSEGAKAAIEKAGGTVEVVK